MQSAAGTGNEIGDDELLPVVIRAGIYLLLFVCAPAFIIVIVGVVNCVSTAHSTRQLEIGDYLARRLDKRHCVAAVLLLITMLVEHIVAMTVEIEAYADNELLTLLLMYTSPLS